MVGKQLTRSGLREIVNDAARSHPSTEGREVAYTVGIKVAEELGFNHLAAKLKEAHRDGKLFVE